MKKTNQVSKKKLFEYLIAPFFILFVAILILIFILGKTSNGYLIIPLFMSLFLFSSFSKETKLPKLIRIYYFIISVPLVFIPIYSFIIHF
ncbi:hypothetical protein SAMN06295997_14513 [Malaciobacter marinus]|jgi:type II secretory pathway component PulF|nr:hypothetical protein SAMN06295997_14513 [Malaciobacter marinus]